MSTEARRAKIEKECKRVGFTEFRNRKEDGVWKVAATIGIVFYWGVNDYRVPYSVCKGADSDIDKPTEEVLQDKKDIKGADLDIDKPLGEPTLQDMINVMTAFKDGAKIQFIDRNEEDTWMQTETPVWAWDEYYYRVAPQPKLRPYTGEELAKLCGTNIIETSDNFSATVIGVNVLRSTVAVVDDTMDICEVVAQTLLDCYTTEDLQPLGVEE